MLPTDAPDERKPPVPSGPDGLRLLLDQAFELGTLYRLRAALAAHATELGASERLVGNLVIAAGELASNAVRHGGGRGRLRLWYHADTLRCEVADQGPGLAGADTAGTVPPPLTATAGRGLWIVRQLVDDLMIACDGSGTVATVSISLQES